MTAWLETDPKRARAYPFVVAWIVLLVLAGASIGIAFVDIGSWAVIAEFFVATVQTAILFLLFMRLKSSSSMKWVFALSGFFWLLLLYGLSMTDYVDRKGWPPIYPPTAGLRDQGLGDQGSGSGN